MLEMIMNLVQQITLIMIRISWVKVQTLNIGVFKLLPFLNLEGLELNVYIKPNNH